LLLSHLGGASVAAAEGQKQRTHHLQQSKLSKKGQELPSFGF